MDFIRRFFQFCQAHYEKVILILALLGLALAVMVLYMVSASEAASTSNYIKETERRNNKKLPPVDMAPYNNALGLAGKPPVLILSPPHNLFNPVKWQERGDGSRIKIETGKETGPDALQIAAVKPLALKIALEKSSGSGFQISVTREAADLLRDRSKQTRFFTTNSVEKFTTSDRSNAITLSISKVVGSADDASELVLKWAELSEEISLGKQKPFERTEAHEVDLSYTAEGRSFKQLRVGQTLKLSGETYKIVAITPTEVVLSSELNEKTYRVRQTVPR